MMIKRLFLFIFLTFIFTALFGCSLIMKPHLSPDEIRAERSGNDIIFSPAGYKFRIPEKWLEWNNEFHNNFHLSADELKQVKDGSGEWDTEYAAVINETIPFESCAAHLGSEGWGSEAYSYTDVQMRVYFTNDSVGRIMDRIKENGKKAANSLEKSENVFLHSSKDGDWQRVIISYDMIYKDYGATAHIDYRICSINGIRVVLVFMFTDYSEDIDNIVNSFRH